MTRWGWCCSNISAARIVGFCGIAAAVLAAIGVGSGATLVRTSNQYLYVLCNYVALPVTAVWLALLLYGALKESIPFLTASLIVQALAMCVVVIGAVIVFILALVRPEDLASKDVDPIVYVPADESPSTATVEDEHEWMKKYLISSLLIGMFVYLVSHIWALLVTRGTRKDLLIQQANRGGGGSGSMEMYDEDKALATV